MKPCSAVYQQYYLLNYQKCHGLRNYVQSNSYEYIMYIVGLFLTWNFTLCVLRYRWEVLPGIHLGKEGWGLQVPSLHTYSEGGEYSNLNPLWQEIEHCIVVGVLWQVATPLLGSAGLIHFPSATNNTGKSCQSWYRTQESIVHVSFNDNI